MRPWGCRWVCACNVRRREGHRRKKSKGRFPLYVSICVKGRLLKPILMREPWATRTTIPPRRPTPPPKGREGKGAAEAPSSPSVTPPLREKGVSTYIGHCSDLYRSRAWPIVVRMRTNIGSLADHYRFHLHSTIGPHMEAIVGWTQTTIALPLHPLFLLRHAPSKTPQCSASDREAQQEGKAASTGQHRDQYW